MFYFLIRRKNQNSKQPNNYQGHHRLHQKTKKYTEFLTACTQVRAHCQEFRSSRAIGQPGIPPTTPFHPGKIGHYHWSTTLT